MFACEKETIDKTNIANENMTEEATTIKSEEIQYYEKKEDLFVGYFKDFYDYIIEYRNGENDLKEYNINNLYEFYVFLFTYEGGIKGFNTASTLLGKYYLKKDIGGSIYDQKKEDGFVGYCIENDKYVQLTEFLVEFFANFRKEEGYTGDGEGQYVYGSDFLAAPGDSIVDVIKYFYYNDNTLPKYFDKNSKTRKMINEIPLQKIN